MPAKSNAKLTRVAREAKGCTRCTLYRTATQTVFGEGPVGVQLMLVGEQPGDQEDLAGRPFVGPAGELLDRCLEEAGIDRSRTYVTNAVKHFKFEPRGKRRLHKNPNTYEIDRCRWWLDHERSIVKPELIVALGATAARSLFERPVVIARTRGNVVQREDGTRLLVTIHPSYLLRIVDARDKAAEYRRFVADLKICAEALAKAA
ncbi:MAG: UdgX family uracil-DNA binding protein [Sphingomonas sp.]|nr:UdgX family uracil-DNA binding protein [Sphingomonas sp.]